MFPFCDPKSNPGPKFTQFSRPNTRLQTKEKPRKRNVYGVFEDGAGGGNRTRVTSLEGWSFTTKQHPRLRRMQIFYTLELRLQGKIVRSLDGNLVL